MTTEKQFETTPAGTSEGFTGLVLLRDFSHGSHDMKYDRRGDAVLKDGRVTSIPTSCPVGRKALEDAVASGKQGGMIGNWDWSLYGGKY
jgi:hypothetical protein